METSPPISVAAFTAVQGTNAIENSIVWGNTDSDANGTVATAQAYADSAFDIFAVTNSIIQGSTNLADGDSGYDPLFANASVVISISQRFHTALADSGVNALVNGSSTDLDGAPRVFGGLVDLRRLRISIRRVVARPHLPPRPQCSHFSCSSLGTVSFQVAGSSAAASAVWQINSGLGFASVTNGGNNAITATALGSTLTLSGINPTINGYQVRAVVAGFATPPATLTISSPTVVYVKQNASGANDGSSWASAFTDLHQAIAAAPGSCTEIWVAAGTYFTQGQSFALRHQLPILGGFAGTETNASQRNWTNHLTILKNDGNFAVVNNGGVSIDASAFLDGFVIQSVNSSFAVFNQNCSPTIQNCTIANCPNLVMWNQGGSPNLVNCVFTNNQSTAVHNLGSSPTFTGCVFINNTANQQTGGAMYNDASSPLVQDCVFQGNTAANGTGIYDYNNSSPTVLRTMFIGNIGQSGGAFTEAGTGSARLESCLFANNISSGLVAAIEHLSGTLNVVNCTIANNTSTRGNAGLLNQSGSANIANSIFWENSVVEQNASQTLETMQLGALGGQISISNSLKCKKSLAAFSGHNNPHYDPLFANPGATNYSLSAYSPAINAGNANFASSPLDLAGARRVFLMAAERSEPLTKHKRRSLPPVALLATPLQPDVNAWAVLHCLLGRASSGQHQCVSMAGQYRFGFCPGRRGRPERSHCHRQQFQQPPDRERRHCGE